MYPRVLAVGVTAAAILGAGGTALALTGSDTTSGSPTTTSTGTASSTPKHPRGTGRLFRRLAHAQIVTRGKNGFVTHDLIRGTVTAVSPTSITVQAADKTSMTFVVDHDTKVRVRQDGHGAASSIAHVAKGDQAMVAGTGTSTFTAERIVDVKK